MSHYQLEYKLHLPADPPWRTVNRNMRRVAQSNSSQDLLQLAIKDMLEMTGYGADPNLTGGLLLDFLNKFDVPMRGALAAGIIDGKGLELSFEKGELVGKIVQKYDSVPVNGEKTTPSGLIIPGGA